MFIIPVILDIVLGLSFAFMKSYDGSPLLIMVFILALIIMYVAIWGRGNLIKTILKILLIGGHMLLAWHGYVAGNWIAAVCAALVALFVIYLCVDEIASRFR